MSTQYSKKINPVGKNNEQLKSLIESFGYTVPDGANRTIMMAFVKKHNRNVKKPTNPRQKLILRECEEKDDKCMVENKVLLALKELHITSHNARDILYRLQSSGGDWNKVTRRQLLETVLMYVLSDPEQALAIFDVVGLSGLKKDAILEALQPYHEVLVKALTNVAGAYNQWVEMNESNIREILKNIIGDVDVKAAMEKQRLSVSPKSKTQEKTRPPSKIWDVLLRNLRP